MNDEDQMSIGEISRTVNRVEKKLDRYADDHEQRLRRCERWVYALPATAFAAAAAFAAAVAQWAVG